RSFCALLLVCVASCSRAAIPAQPSFVTGAGTRSPVPTTKPDLLYVSSSDKVRAFEYPQGKLVQTLSGFFTPSGLCADGAGNVFVTNFGGESVWEYARAGSSPIAKLRDPYEQPN